MVVLVTPAAFVVTFVLAAVAGYVVCKCRLAIKVIRRTPESN